MVRGRVQVEWRCSNQTRATTQRDWLNLQLSGRGFIAEQLPGIIQKAARGFWLTIANVGFDTVADGQQILSLAQTRLAADPLIAAGSWVTYHECRHEDGANDCVSTLVRTVK